MLVTLRLPLRFVRPNSSGEAEFAFLQPRFTPRTVFMEIGAPDCKLALRAAGYVERVYAIDVSGQFLHTVAAPCNLRLVLCGGVRLPVPEGSVHLAYSRGFIDQLHLDDAQEHLRSVRRSLAPGGEYICASASPAATGSRMLLAGFSAVRLYVGAVRIPWMLASLVSPQRLRIHALR